MFKKGNYGWIYFGLNTELCVSKPLYKLYVPVNNTENGGLVMEHMEKQLNLFSPAKSCSSSSGSMDPGPSIHTSPAECRVARPVFETAPTRNHVFEKARNRICPDPGLPKPRTRF